MNNFSDYDTAVALINFEEEVNDFKYSKERNHDENNYYLKYLCKMRENIIAYINKDKELLMVDVKNIPSSLLLVKYQKQI